VRVLGLFPSQLINNISRQGEPDWFGNGLVWGGNGWLVSPLLSLSQCYPSASQGMNESMVHIVYGSYGLWLLRPAQSISLVKVRAFLALLPLWVRVEQAILPFRRFGALKVRLIQPSYESTSC
jgi:hypothetical protein